MRAWRTRNGPDQGEDKSPVLVDGRSLEAGSNEWGWLWTEIMMADGIYLGLVLAFFSLSWALVGLCERL